MRKSLGMAGRAGRCLSIMLSIVLLTACATSQSPAPVVNSWNRLGTSQRYYVVQPGDTLYSIAWRFNVSDQKLAAYNQIPPPYVVKPGQKLRLIAMSTKQAVPKVSSIKEKSVAVNASPSKAQAQTTNAAVPKNEGTASGRMSWPVKGKVISQYGQDGNKGINIAVPQGTEVRAVEAGTVVYSGSNLHGYGQLIIIKHDNNVMTAYAHNSKLLLKEGATVTNGQVIALSGHTEASQDMLHFEVRQNGKPVNPMNFLNAQG